MGVGLWISEGALTVRRCCSLFSSSMISSIIWFLIVPSWFVRGLESLSLSVSKTTFGLCYWPGPKLTYLWVWGVLKDSASFCRDFEWVRSCESSSLCWVTSICTGSYPRSASLRPSASDFCSSDDFSDEMNFKSSSSRSTGNWYFLTLSADRSGDLNYYISSSSFSAKVAPGFMILWSALVTAGRDLRDEPPRRFGECMMAGDAFSGIISIWFIVWFSSLAPWSC